MAIDTQIMMMANYLTVELAIEKSAVIELERACIIRVMDKIAIVSELVDGKLVNKLQKFVSGNVYKTLLEAVGLDVITKQEILDYLEGWQ